MQSRRAFSLIELVVIVFLLGTLALLAAPSLHRTLLESEVDRAAAEVVSTIRYARSLAVTGVPHFVIFDTDVNQVSVWSAADLTPAPHPVRKQRDCVLSLGVKGCFEHVDLESADFSGDDKVAFDQLGNASGQGEVVLSGGGFQRTVRVEALGGTVTIQ